MQSVKRQQFCLIVLLLYCFIERTTALIGTDDPYQIYSSGSNNHGQLGINDRSDRSVPSISQGVIRPVKVIAASKHSLAITADGIVYGWGEESQGQLILNADGGLPSQDGSNFKFDVVKPTNLALLGGYQIIALSSGLEHTIACSIEGDIWVFGR